MTMAEDAGNELDENGNPITKIGKGESRFYKLTKLDEIWSNYKPDKPFDNNLTLEQICERFRNYSASVLGL